MGRDNDDQEGGLQQECVCEIMAETVGISTGWKEKRSRVCRLFVARSIVVVVGRESGDKLSQANSFIFLLQSSGSSNPSTTTFHFHLPSKNP